VEKTVDLDQHIFSCGVFGIAAVLGKSKNNMDDLRMPDDFVCSLDFLPTQAAGKKDIQGKSCV
jgi:hypothetical protein